MDREPFDFMRANRIASDFQYLIGMKLVNNMPETAISHVVVAPYSLGEQEVFARQFIANPATSCINLGNKYDVICLVCIRPGKTFLVDVRMLAEQYGIRYDFSLCYSTRKMLAFPASNNRLITLYSGR